MSVQSVSRGMLGAALILALIGGGALYQRHNTSQTAEHFKQLLATPTPPSAITTPVPGLTKEVAYAASKVTIVGRSGKYPIYDLPSNDLDAIKYIDSKGRVWSSRDIIAQVMPIEKRDADSTNYRCETICVNEKNEVVGRYPF